MLRRLAPLDFPHFDAIVHCLAACRTPDAIGEAQLEKYNVLPSLSTLDKANRRYRDLLLALEAISAISHSVRTTLEGKTEMAAMLFDSASVVERSEGTAAILESLDGDFPRESYVRSRVARDTDGLARLAALAAGAHKIAPDRISIRLNTGL